MTARGHVEAYAAEIGFDFEPDEEEDGQRQTALPTRPLPAARQPQAQPVAFPSSPLAEGATAAAVAPVINLSEPSSLNLAAAPTAFLANHTAEDGDESLAAPGDITAEASQRPWSEATATPTEGILLAPAAAADDDLPSDLAALPPETDFAAGDVLPDYLSPQHEDTPLQAGRDLDEDAEIADLLAALGHKRQDNEGTPPIARALKSVDAIEEAPNAPQMPLPPHGAAPSSAETEMALADAPDSQAPAENATAAMDLPPDATWNRGGLPPDATPAPAAAEAQLSEDNITDLLPATAAAAQLPAAAEFAADGRLPPLLTTNEERTTSGGEALAADADLTDLLKPAVATPPSAAAAKTLAMPRVEDQVPSPPKDEAASILTEAKEETPKDGGQVENSKRRDTIALLEQGLLSSPSGGEPPSSASASAASSRDAAPLASGNEAMPPLASASQAATSSSPPPSSPAVPGSEDITMLLASAGAVQATSADSVFAQLSATEGSQAGTEKHSPAREKLRHFLAMIAWEENWWLYFDLLAALIFTLSLAVIISHFLWRQGVEP